MNDGAGGRVLGVGSLMMATATERRKSDERL